LGEKDAASNYKTSKDFMVPHYHHSLKCINFNFDDMAIATAELQIRRIKMIK
jgi:hypothetical protein